jgi:glycosyltransferase involved in cell wall biosynthesis
VRVAITHMGFIPHYRVTFFEHLARISGSEYVVFHSAPPAGLGLTAAHGPFAFPNVFVNAREITIGRKSLVYQPIVAAVQRGRYDAVVMGTHLQFISNHIILALSRAVHRPVLYWGHGSERAVGDGALSRHLAQLGVGVKRRLARLPDGYLVYTQGGADRLVTQGMSPERITVVPNTLDMDAQVRLHDELRLADEGALRRELDLGADSVVLLYLGSIYPEKRLDLLLRAVRALSREAPLKNAFEVVVVGDGPGAAEARAAAADLSMVSFVGELQDQRIVARYLKVAAAVVVPGILGLVVNHALAHGVPVVTLDNQLHGPEVEYLTPGVNAVLAPDMDGLVSSLARLIRSEGERRRLADGAMSGRNQLSLERMVQSFHEGVTRAVTRASR